MKICTECKTEKPLTEFWPDRSKKHGYTAKCKACRVIRAREYRQRTGYCATIYQRNKTKERERHLIKKYGVNLAQYDAMFISQNGCCAICGKSQKRSFDVDHCHSTGKVRGLLCTSCNRFIGHAGDDPARLIKAANYLKSYMESEYNKTLAARDLGSNRDPSPNS